MSFILDALRKSEHERQRGAVPAISQIPFAAPRRELPLWALAVIAALGICVLALAGAWWTSTRAGPSQVPAAVAAAPRPAADAPFEIPLRPAEERGAAPAMPQPAVAPSARANRPLADLTESSAAPITQRTTPAALPPASAPPPARNVASSSVLPSAAALAAGGIALPPLRLELHMFHRDRPADRLIIINGGRYREGDVLREGPRVVAIEATGAILNYQGRDFYLSPE